MSDPNRIYIPDSRHSPVGPSGSDRWMNCHGSNQMIAKLPTRPRTSPEAEEGSAAHAVLATCLQSGRAAWELAGKTVVIGKNEYIVNEVMVEGIQLAIDEVARLRAEYPNGILYVERELFSVLDEEAYGAGDIIYEVPGVAIFVLDLKYGQGVVVEPTKPQTRIYGYYAYEQRSDLMRGINDPTKIICGIIQPRIPHPQGPIRYATYDCAETEEWFATVVLADILATREPGAILKVGDWCTFCDLNKAHACPAIWAAAKNFDSTVDPTKLTVEEIDDMLPILEILCKKKAGLEQELFHRMMTGSVSRHNKLVHKKGARVFRESIIQTIPSEVEGEEPEQVTVALADALLLEFGLDAYEPAEPKTPPAIEKLVGGKAFVARWAYKPDTGLTIAPMSDSRTPVKAASLMDRMEEEAQPSPVDGVVV